MNYNHEIEHDKQLISLVQTLAATNQLHIVQEAFGIDHLGTLTHAQRRQPFDVQLTFSDKLSNKLSIVIETKVDSNESINGEKWQTEYIAERAPALEYLRGHRLVFLFITYGTSEFYTKPYQIGAASPAFKHIGLNDMINLVGSAVDVLPRSRSEEYQEWLRLMCVEKDKRDRAVELLQLFSVFRKEYLGISNENDFPRNRLTFYAPELAFPVFNSLAQQWKRLPYAEEFGQLSLYPVERWSPPHDSVLNFLEMRQSDKFSLGATIDGLEKRALYFEINEDFNLNIKIEQEELGCKARNEIKSRLQSAGWPSFVNGQRRDYKQQVFVLYEIDFGFLENLNNMTQMADNLATAVRVAVQALS